MQSKFAWLIALAALTLGCASKPSRPALTAEEQLKQDQKVGAEWAVGLEETVRFRQDTEITVFLRGLAERLASQDPALKDAPVGVFLVDEVGGKWTSFALPGNRIYLSVGWLKTVELESELAAGIAVQLGHLQGRYWVRRGESWVEGMRPPLFGAGGMLELTDVERLDAADFAVELLYRSGIDPRGTIALWSNLKNHFEVSPVPEDLCGQLLEKSRQAITQFTPLRNPIVRSAEFIKLKKRIERL